MDAVIFQETTTITKKLIEKFLILFSLIWYRAASAHDNTETYIEQDKKVRENERARTRKEGDKYRKKNKRL